ncbi:response regulator [Elusimicrobiota bacterium]
MEKASQNNINIMLVDDEMYMRVVIRAYFAPYNVIITEARNGEEAIELMKENEYDLIILDNHMPGMSGQQVLNLMLEDVRLSKIPVIMYTAGKYEKEVESRLKKMSSAYLEKSSLGEELIPTTCEILGDRLRLQI